MEKGRKLKEVSLESQWTQGGTALTVPEAKSLPCSHTADLYGGS